MRKGLAAIAVLSSLAVAGCAGGGSESAPAQQPGPPPAPAGPVRNAPAKSVDLADKCSILKPEQLKQLGLDQAPRPFDMTGQGVPGCRYQSAKPVGEGGSAVNVGLNPNQTTAQFQASAPGRKKQLTVAGYPAVDSVPVRINCIVSVDVSDRGSLTAVSQVSPGGQMADPCQIANQAAEAAVQNLPNA